MEPLADRGRRRAHGDPRRNPRDGGRRPVGPGASGLAAAGVILIAGGLAALALVPSASIGWTFPRRR